MKGDVIVVVKGSGHEGAISLVTDHELRFGIFMAYLDEGGATRHSCVKIQVMS